MTQLYKVSGDSYGVEQMNLYMVGNAQESRRMDRRVIEVFIMRVTENRGFNLDIRF